MKTYVGIDYHKRYSYGVIMTEDRTILKQGKFASKASLPITLKRWLDSSATIAARIVMPFSKQHVTGPSCTIGWKSIQAKYFSPIR